MNPKSAAYGEEAANATHIPYPKDLPSPANNNVRVPAVNPAALFGPDDDGSG